MKRIIIWIILLGLSLLLRLLCDGTDKKAGQVCSGIYFVRLESGNKNHIHKMVMMK